MFIKIKKIDYVPARQVHFRFAIKNRKCLFIFENIR